LEAPSLVPKRYFCHQFIPPKRNSGGRSVSRLKGQRGDGYGRRDPEGLKEKLVRATVGDYVLLCAIVG